jgi:2-hydroxychromene-2-carboxylate isomerase/predicted thioesterase
VKEIAAGLRASLTIAPEPWHSAAAIGNAGVDAVSTPSIVGFLEQASLEAIRDRLEPGEISVGRFVSLEHVAPAFPGRPVECVATLREVAGRHLKFDIHAEQEGSRVAYGDYTRVVVRSPKFTAAPSGQAKPKLRFFFDFHSPWSYLASQRLPLIALRHGREIEWIPIHLARLAESIRGRQPLTENEAFVRWYRQDLQDWAAAQGIAIRYHPHFPLRTAPALRVAQLAAEQGKAAAFVSSVMRSYWSDAIDISAAEELAAIAERNGIAPADAVAAMSNERIKRKVLQNTEDAERAGVFGTPSVIAEGKLFFGNDRLELLDHFLTRTSFL